MPLCLANDKKSLEAGINQLGGDEFVAKPLIGAATYYGNTQSSTPGKNV